MSRWRPTGGASVQDCGSKATDARPSEPIFMSLPVCVGIEIRAANNSETPSPPLKLRRIPAYRQFDRMTSRSTSGSFLEALRRPASGNHDNPSCRRNRTTVSLANFRVKPQYKLSASPLPLLHRLTRPLGSECTLASTWMRSLGL